jgi:uncharacterized membrane protein YphA (DoxX/SURF4 family)
MQNMAEQVQAPAYAPVKRQLGWQIALWTAQLALLAVFGMSGYFKTVTPYAQILPMMQKGGLIIPEGLLRFIGISELLGALGMVLPALTRLWPVLTAWAGVGLATIMVLASALHASRGEFDHMAITLALLVPAAFVAWGRFRKVPILPRR